MTLKHLGVGVALLFTTLLGTGVATAASANAIGSRMSSPHRPLLPLNLAEHR